MFSLEDMRRAHEVVLGALRPTPALFWPLLAERLGADVVVKHENHLPTGAFKVRGGLVYVDALTKREPATRGLVSATRGNHGQSLAFAGRRAGLKVKIFVPEGNSREKNAAMRALGADVVEFGHDFQAAREEAMRLAEARRLHMVPSFHRDLALGVSTYALELLNEHPDLDTLYVPIGQGSGICGCIAARDALGLRTESLGSSRLKRQPTRCRSMPATWFAPTAPTRLLMGWRRASLTKKRWPSFSKAPRGSFSSAIKRSPPPSEPIGPIPTISPKARALRRSQRR